MSLEESQARYKAAGRNDACPCGSGKKYKKCHFIEDEAQIHADRAAQRAATEAAAAETEAEEAANGNTKGAAAVKKPKPPQSSARKTGSKARAQAARAGNLPRRGAV